MRGSSSGQFLRFGGLCLLRSPRASMSLKRVSLRDPRAAVGALLLTGELSAECLVGDLRPRAPSDWDSLGVAERGDSSPRGATPSILSPLCTASGDGQPSPVPQRSKRGSSWSGTQIFERIRRSPAISRGRLHRVVGKQVARQRSVAAAKSGTSDVLHTKFTHVMEACSTGSSAQEVSRV